MQLSPPACRAPRSSRSSAGALRCRAGHRITDRRLLQQRAGRLLSEFESFVAECQHTDTASDLLRIGTFEVFSTHVMGWAIEHYLSKRPVLLREVGPADLESAVLKREIDIGITSIPIPNEALDFLKVASQDLAIYGRASVFGDVAFVDLPFCVPISPVSGAARSQRPGTRTCVACSPKRLGRIKGFLALVASTRTGRKPCRKSCVISPGKPNSG